MSAPDQAAVQAGRLTEAESLRFRQLAGGMAYGAPIMPRDGAARPGGTPHTVADMLDYLARLSERLAEVAERDRRTYSELERSRAFVNAGRLVFDVLSGERDL